MPLGVFLTADAARDLEKLYSYIAAHDAGGKEEHLLSGIEKAIDTLSEFPGHSAHPKELLALGIHDYREIFFKPYRIIYKVMGDNVYIFLIADGRRDMQTLLQRRLLDV